MRRQCGKQDIELLPCRGVPVRHPAIVYGFPGTVVTYISSGMVTSYVRTYICTSVTGGSVLHLVYSVL